MLSRSAWALVLCAILLASGLPGGVAESPSADCPPTICRWLPLYAQPAGALGALSVLPGDGAPGPTTVTNSGSISWRTDILERGLVLAKQDAFRVILTAQHEQAVSGNVSVAAVGANGAIIPLGWQSIFSAGPAQVNDTASTVDRTVDQTRTLFQGPLVSNGLQAARAAGCNPLRTVCSTVSGDPELLILNRPCASTEPLAQNSIIPFLAWYGVQSVERRELFQPGSRPINQPWPAPSMPLPIPDTGERICRDRWTDVNATAATLDDIAVSGGDQLPSVDPAPRMQDWRNVTLNATPPSWMAQNADTFTLPHGMRLQFTMRLQGATPGAPAPIVQFGRADAPTRLEIRTASPDIFPFLAFDAQRIGAGSRDVAFATPFDARDFLIEVPATSSFDIFFVGATGQLWTPQGERVSPTALHTGEGLWTLRLLPNGGGSAPSPMTGRLVVRMHAETTEPVLALAPGTTTGSMDASNTVDLYTFTASYWQPFEVRLDHAPDADLDLTLQERALPGSVPAFTRESGPGYEIVRGRGALSGPLDVKVARNFGDTSYTLTLWLDPEGDLTNVPPFTSLYTPGNGILLSGLSSYGGGVDVSAQGHLMHVDRTGNTSIGNTGSFYPTARAADGTPAYSSWVGGPRIHFGVGPEQNPIAQREGQVVFDATGSLLVAGFRPGRIHEDRTIEDVPGVRLVLRYTVAPDGTIYAVADMGGGNFQTVIVDLDAGTVLPAPAAMQRVGAFDAAGNPYRIRDWNGLLIERIDLATNTSRIVARSALPTWEFAVGGMDLYALTCQFPSPTCSISFVDVGRLGFEGYHPDYQPLAAPDLTPVALEDQVLGIDVDPSQGAQAVAEMHRFTVVVDNVGPGASLPTKLHLSHCPFVCQSPWSATVDVPAIPAGGEARVVVDARIASHAGDQTLRVHVDPTSSQAETNEENNRANFGFSAFVRGNGALCRSPISAPSTACTLTEI